MVKIKNKKGGNPDLYANHITILCSIIICGMILIAAIVLYRLPVASLEKFIDNCSYFIGGLGIGIAIERIFDPLKNLLFKKND